MKKVVISEELRTKLPAFSVGVTSFTVNVQKTDKLDKLINDLQVQIRQKYTLSDVLQIPNIKSARDGYKKLGKDPSRYRLAVESLYRRIVKNNDLYRINDVVDIGNILSILTQRSVAVLDEEKIVGDVLIRIGKDEPYEGIGRGEINIENIPVYTDGEGPFGTPTSDTLRTAITDNTRKVLLFIISFDGKEVLEKDLKLCKELYENYTDAKDFYFEII
ncbi:MAG: hypothetical protein GX676_02230 [Bacilli bacterium]|nr:hypothetical protein [Bacilli bacterium]